MIFRAYLHAYFEIGILEHTFAFPTHKACKISNKQIMQKLILMSLAQSSEIMEFLIKHDY